MFYANSGKFLETLTFRYNLKTNSVQDTNPTQSTNKNTPLLKNQLTKSQPTRDLPNTNTKRKEGIEGKDPIPSNDKGPTPQKYTT